MWMNSHSCNNKLLGVSSKIIYEWLDLLFVYYIYDWINKSILKVKSWMKFLKYLYYKILKNILRLLGILRILNILGT